jgi:16S rRNA U1498 N3-methylase RsmE
VLVVGPEGRIQRELDTFVARGFPPALGPPILRVETAVAALLDQLLLTGSSTSRRTRDR